MDIQILTKENEASTSRFDSIADTVKVTAKYSSKTDVNVTVWCFDGQGNKCEGYTQAYPASDNGELIFCFDPVSFSVYQNAETFEITLTAEGLSITSFSVSEENNAAISENDETFVNTTVTENGEKGVYVTQISGERIVVPRVPKKVLFVGNSLVFGMFGAYGMCSSAPDKDYYHHVTEHIRKINPSCMFFKQHGAEFEHAETLEAVDEWYYRNDSFEGKGAIERLTPDLDLILLQLGDNVNTDSKQALFEKTSAELLIARIKERCPKARIIWIYGWYSLARTVGTVKSLCEKWGIESIDISVLHTEENEGRKQKACISPEGVVCDVDARWVSHPGDLGMKRIAEKIIAKLDL
ncbi:MAG: SGNH/GDSL hydrolase family protein [Clostridia bacterium]|nr:SGNH/GDSL hydrolase family protein [Clostridia bacterium]